MALLLDIVGSGEGSVDYRSEVLAHLQREAEALSANQIVDLVLHDQIEQPSDGRGDRGIETDTEAAVRFGFGGEFTARQILALQAIEIEVIIVALYYTPGYFPLGSEQPGCHAVGDKTGALGIGQNHHFGNDRSCRSVCFAKRDADF